MYDEYIKGETIMRVILKERIQGQGAAGSIITVKRGYARNFLFPQGLAVAVNAENLAWLEDQKAEFIKQDKVAMESAQKMAAACQDLVLEIKVACKDNDALYGSVGTSDVADAFKEKGIDMQRNLIVIAEGTIKALGTYTAVCHLHDAVVISVPVHIVSDKVDG